MLATDLSRDPPKNIIQSIDLYIKQLQSTQNSNVDIEEIGFLRLAAFGARYYRVNWHGNGGV